MDLVKTLTGTVREVENRSLTKLTKFYQLFTTYLLWLTFAKEFIPLKSALHAIDKSCNTYPPLLVNMVKERPLDSRNVL